MNQPAQLIMEGVDVLTAGVVSEVVVVLSTQDDSAVGKFYIPVS